MDERKPYIDEIKREFPETSCQTFFHIRGGVSYHTEGVPSPYSQLPARGQIQYAPLEHVRYGRACPGRYV